VAVEPPIVDALDALARRHERVRAHLLAARSLLAEAPQAEPLATAAEEPADGSPSRTAEAVLLFFTVVWPLHVCDEAEDLCSLVCARSADSATEALVARVRASHREIECTIDVLLPAWEAVARRPEQRSKLRDGMAPPTADLVRLVEEHLELVEGELWEAARRLLSANDRADLLAAFRARRGRVCAGTR
jgi:hypothetical protein